MLYMKVISPTQQADVDWILESLFYKTDDVDDVGHDTGSTNNLTHRSKENPLDYHRNFLANLTIRHIFS